MQDQTALVAELQAGVTTETEVARIERYQKLHENRQFALF
jgi:hypothetical protein